MAYKVEDNIVSRDGAAVAIVQVDGSLVVPEGMEKYRTQAVKELAKAGRRRNDGTFIFSEGEGAPETENAPDVPAEAPKAGDIPEESAEEPETEQEPESAPVERRVISTVRELVAAVEAATGEKAPALSKIYGDETPEVWSYLRRNVAAYNAIKQSFDIRITNNHIEE